MLKVILDKDFDVDEFNQKRITFPDIEDSVRGIIQNIERTGIKGVYNYTKKFDKTNLKEIGIKVKKREIEKAHNYVLKKNKEFIRAIKEAIKRIREFHINQVEKNFILTKNKDEVLGQILQPIEKVLIYVPGGNALYPSTLIMNAIPAQIAGVSNIYVTTPVKENISVSKEILATMYELGLTELYQVGGVQALTAFAYGIDLFPKVNKIVGPGNIYLTIAKKILFGVVDIDMIAGPTEILIIANKNTNSDNIALDLLAQAEHDELATPILVTTSMALIKKVNLKIKYYLKKYKNKIALKSITKNGIAILVKSIERAFELANQIAPEHLEIMIENPFLYLNYVKNAGSVFLGNYSPESAGDYIAGPNHTLPTMGTSKFFSQLGVYDFVKRTGFIYFSKEKLNELQPYISKLAETENLLFHSLSVKLRK